MAKRRVVVTGMGAVTPIGLSVYEFWQNVKAQKTGFSEITKFDTTNYKCKLAAEVKEFDAKNYMDAKEARRMELFSQYAVAAAKEAIEDAGLEMDQEDPYMAGCAIGSGVGSLQAIERENILRRIALDHDHIRLAAGLQHIVQEARHVSRVGHADGKALGGGIHHLEQLGGGRILLQVAGLAIVQMQVNTALAGSNLAHKTVFIKILNPKHKNTS